jgi:starvation-inducible DNA-binding protein
MTEVLNVKTDVDIPETGLADEHHKRLASGLSGILADTYLLMVKTHGYHWNVVGPLFVSLHTLTEQHYEDMFQAIDDIAERVRGLGFPAPGSITEMIPLSEIREDTTRSSAEDMVENLIGDHEKIVRRLRETAEIADEMSDGVTSDMLTARMAFHEKAIWMLRSTVAQ